MNGSCLGSANRSDGQRGSVFFFLYCVGEVSYPCITKPLWLKIKPIHLSGRFAQNDSFKKSLDLYRECGCLIMNTQTEPAANGIPLLSCSLINANT